MSFRKMQLLSSPDDGSISQDMCSQGTDQIQPSNSTFRNVTNKCKKTIYKTFTVMLLIIKKNRYLSTQ